MWEDPRNASGGHFKITVKNKDASVSLWHTLTLAMVLEEPPRPAQVRPPPQRRRRPLLTLRLRCPGRSLRDQICFFAKDRP